MGATGLAIHRLEPQSARGRARLAKILEAATSLFLKVGYESASIDTILLESGGSKSTLYAYFPTKEDLFRAVIDNVVDNDVAVSLDVGGDVRAVLTEFAVARQRVVLSPRHCAVLRLVVAGRERFPDLARMYLQRGPLRTQYLLARYLDAQRVRGALDIDDAEEAAEFFVGMLLQRWNRQLLYPTLPVPSEANVRQRAERVVARFIAAYRPRSHWPRADAVRQSGTPGRAEPCSHASPSA